MIFLQSFCSYSMVPTDLYYQNCRRGLPFREKCSILLWKRNANGNWLQMRSTMVVMISRVSSVLSRPQEVRGDPLLVCWCFMQVYEPPERDVRNLPPWFRVWHEDSETPSPQFWSKRGFRINYVNPFPAQINLLNSPEIRFWGPSLISILSNSYWITELKTCDRFSSCLGGFHENQSKFTKKENFPDQNTFFVADSGLSRTAWWSATITYLPWALGAFKSLFSEPSSQAAPKPITWFSRRLCWQKSLGGTHRNPVFWRLWRAVSSWI